MKIYTLQIGSGSDNNMKVLEHSETLSGNDLPDAIRKAKQIILAGTWRSDSTLVRLLHETGEDSVVKWFRPMEAVRGA